MSTSQPHESSGAAPEPPPQAPRMAASAPAPDDGAWEALLTAAARLETVATMLAARAEAPAPPPDPRPQTAALGRIALSLDQTAAQLAGISSAPAARQPAVSQGVVERDCGCVDDRCCDPGCCCWEVRLIAVRMLAGTPLLKPEEPVDGETGLLGIGNGFEAIVYVAADGVGIVHPSLMYPMTLTKPTGQPGGWVTTGSRTINRICFPRNRPRSIDIEIQAMESDEKEPILGGQNEYGTAASSMTLECCGQRAGPVDIDVFFNMGGTGEGAIQVRIDAIRVS